MGISIGTPVHWPTGTHMCRPAWIWKDNPPEFDMADLFSITFPNGVAQINRHQDIPRQMPPVVDPPVGGQWHYPDDCPYANG